LRFLENSRLPSTQKDTTFYLDIRGTEETYYTLIYTLYLSKIYIIIVNYLEK